MSRRNRQREEIASALRRGQYERALVLSREHLAEFPDETEVQTAAEEAARGLSRGG